MGAGKWLLTYTREDPMACIGDHIIEQYVLLNATTEEAAIVEAREWWAAIVKQRKEEQIFILINPNPRVIYQVAL